MNQIVAVLAIAVWVAGLVAFGVYAFRGHWRWLLWGGLGLVVVIASGFLHQALLENAGYRGFLEVAARIGLRIVIIAATVLVVVLVSLVIYTIRYGKSDERQGTVVRENRALNLSLSTQFPMGRSKRKIVASKGSFLTMESFVDGTATFGDRMMVAGMIMAVTSFLLIFVGIGLILMKGLLIMALFPVVPGLWLLNIGREAWHDYQRAKKKVAGRISETASRASQTSSSARQTR